MNAQTPGSGLVNDPELRRELDATLQARRELGPEYEPALVESFLATVDARLESTLETRIRRRIAEQQASAARTAPVGPAAAWAARHGFGIVSLVLAVPLSAVGSAGGGLTGLVVAWAGIVGVNIAHTRHRDA
ncbi:hypothetical protein LG634_15755 [Streptomyces bambusae]|uniref:hypothetical protein n=1 Tax=Streptomyces bambusae TaxID=1550616 RepID=UPI001CFDA8EA|nr:hypothetical protein [Streptomyces bambusae]MCB5166284.1 hypothetical protein [Streptomyces bambusae]